MNIRYKLTLQFTFIVASILLVFSVGIYSFSKVYRESDYYKRLYDRAYTTARLLLEVNEVDENLLRIIDKNTLALFQEEVYIFNERKNKIYSNTNKSYNPERAILSLEDENILRFRDNEREAIAFVYEFDGQKFYVISSAYDLYGIDKIKNLKIVLIVGYLLSLIITLAAGLIFSGKALQPISKAVNQVKNISISKLNLRLDEGNKKDEIAQLAITFNQMLQSLEEAFILQRDFVSNAAHELRTPFTVMLAEIEYSLLQERTKEQYTTTLKRLSEEIRDISHLSNGLLDLARISFDKTNLEYQNVRLDEILIDTCNDVLKANNEYKTHINFESLPENENLLVVSGNEQLLKIAFKNLIENACKFSCSKDVFIDMEVNTRSVILHIKDNGIGIPKEDINSIFQAFYRGANTQFFAGYGLGLALTLKIVQLHNGSIKVKSEVGKGSVFSVSLPNSKNGSTEM